MKPSKFVAFLMTVAAVLSVTALSTPASAQHYAGARGSVFLPNTSEDGLKEFDTGFGGDVFAGFRLTPNFALEAGAGYYRSIWEDEADIITEKDTVSSIPLTFTALGILPITESARVYAGAGVGAYFVRAKAEGSWKEFDELGGDVARSDTANDTAFGYHAVVGGEYLVAPRVGLQTQATWFKAEPTFSFFEDSANPTSVKPDIGGFKISLGVVFQL